MQNKFIFCVIFFLLQYFSSEAQCISNRYLQRIFSSARTYEDLLYNRPLQLQGACLIETNTDTVDYNLDVYEPVGDTLQKRPCIVYAHGGAFLIGDRRMVPIDSFCHKMAMRGYVVVSIDYRKCFNVASSESSIRAVYRAVQDMKAAIRYVKGNAAWLRIDTNMVFAAGNSAGSIMAIHAAYADEYERVLLPATFTQPDLGCLECSGNNYTGIGKPKAVLNFWGAIIDTLAINAGDVPMFSVHGSGDVLVFPEYASPFSYPAFPSLYGSAPITRRMNNVGVVNEFHYMQGLPHEPWLFTSPLYVDTFSQWASEFLYRELLKPKPLITAAPTACTRDTFTYSVANNIGSQYCWNIQGGTIVNHNRNEIKVVWNTAGTGIIELKEKNLYDAVSDVVSKQITVHQKPIALAGIDQSICINDSVQLNGFGGTQYLWTPYDWINGATTASPVVFPKVIKEYVLRVYNGYCYDYDTLKVTVNPLPEIVSKGNINICKGDTGIVEVFTNGSVLWQPTTGLENNQAIVTKAFPQTTTTYTVIATDNNNCTNQNTVKVTVNDVPPVPAINAYQNFLSTVSGYSYQWFLNDTLLPNFSNNIIQPTVNGNYQVKITNQYGCSEISAYYFFESPSGIFEKNNSELIIFPNPSDGKISIQFENNNQHYSISIFDISGKQVFNSENISGEITIDISLLPQSVFFAHIIMNETTFIKKLVKY
jgi:dienelactone hydrolase